MKSLPPCSYSISPVRLCGLPSNGWLGWTYRDGERIRAGYCKRHTRGALEARDMGWSANRRSYVCDSCNAALVRLEPPESES